MALSTSPMFCATAPELSVAFSSSPATASVVSLAFGPSSHSIFKAASPFFAAPIWSATTATASSSRTICRTPLTAFAAASSTRFTRPPNTGDCASVAIFTPGGPNVDAIDGRAVDLPCCVQTLGRRADELEILRPLERHVFGDRHAGGVGGKLAICGAFPRRRVQHFTTLRAAGRCIHIPALCRRGDEHGSRGRTGLAQRLPRRAYRAGIAGCLYASQPGITVELFVGRSMLQPHLFQLHLQLFCDQHGDRGIGALAHLDVGHGQGNLPVASNADEGVGRETSGTGGFGFATCERQAQAQQQASARGRSGLQEGASGDAARR